MANNAIKRRQAKLLFEQWRSGLADRDRSHSKLAENFDDLFYELDRNNIDFELAHEYLDLAIAAHLPDKRNLDYTFKRTGGFGQTKDEFHEKWKKKIRDEATNVFYARYPLEDDDAKEESPLPQGMSKDEYLRQRRYANSFPPLDLNQIPDVEDLPDDTDVSFTIDDLEN
jgi:hypothetical protein